MNNQTTTIGNVKIVYDDYKSNTGWICPKCGRSISPEYKTCPYCTTQYTEEGLAPGERIICDAM